MDFMFLAILDFTLLTGQGQQIKQGRKSDKTNRQTETTNDTDEHVTDDSWLGAKCSRCSRTLSLTPPQGATRGGGRCRTPNANAYIVMHIAQ